MQILRLFLVLFFALNLQPNLIAAQPPVPLLPFPICSELLTRMARFPNTVDTVIQELKGRRVKVIFVPGILSDALTHLGEYFDDQIAFLKRHDIEAHLMSRDDHGWDSEKSAAVNADVLARWIEGVRSSEQVFLVSHSKGGLDTLYLLVKYPRLHAKIAGWTALQAPFRGSPTVDWILSLNPIARVAIYGLLKLLRGDKESLREISTAGAREYLEKNSEKVGEILNTVPIISYGSSILDATGRPIDTFLNQPLIKIRPLAQLLNLDFSPFGLLANRGFPYNDGLVALESTQLGPPPVVQLGVDHAMPVMGHHPLTGNALTDYNRNALLMSLFEMIFEQ